MVWKEALSYDVGEFKILQQGSLAISMECLRILHETFKPAFLLWGIHAKKIAIDVCKIIAIRFLWKCFGRNEN